MLKSLCAAAIAATSLIAAGTTAASAQTINVLVMQEDWDKQSVKRNSRIQNAVLSTLNQTLHAPAYTSHMEKFGIQGMDVYDETILTLPFYKQDRVRRRDEELYSVVRDIRNPRIDVAVLYTLYAKAVTDPYTNVAKLQMSLNYRALGVREGRYLGGDNLDIDTSGIPFTGCAAGIEHQKPDPHCVLEFVSEHAERLARDAGNKMALQLGALLGRAYGNPEAAGVAPGGVPAGDGEEHAAVTPGAGYGHGCRNIPAVYQIIYRGFSQRQVNFIEENMAHWKCILHMDTTSSGFSEAAFEYKTRASQGRILRNIRLMSELMGIIVEPKTQGANEIVVEALTLRSN